MSRQGYYFAAVIFGAGGQFLAGYLMSQNLNLADFGAFSLILSIISSLSALILFGQATAMSVVIFADEKVDNSYIRSEIRSSLMVIFFAFCLVSTLLAITWYVFYYDEWAFSQVSLILIGGLAMAVQLFFMSLVQQLDHYKGYLFSAAVGAVTLTIFAWTALTPTVYILGMLVASIATGVSVIFFAATEFFQEKSNAEGKIFNIRELVLLGYIAVPGMLITAANGVADKFLLSKFLSLEAVGLYSLGFLISVGVGRVLVSGILRANSIYFMRYLQRGDFMNASMILKRSEFLICGFSIVAFVVYYTFGEELVMIILGEKYVLAYPLMLCLFIAVMLEGMAFFLGQALIQKKKLYLLVINNFVLLCLAVSLNYFLIPVFGVSGPAIVLFVSYWVTLLVVFYQVKSIAEWVRFPRYIFATATSIFMFNQLYGI